MKKKILFLLGGGVYPYVVGGMEIFNYFLIRELRNWFDVSVFAEKDFDYDGVNRIESWRIRPEKIFKPLQLLFYRIFHRDDIIVVICFAEAHWLIWFLYGLVIRVTRTKSVAIIHHGGIIPRGNFFALKSFFRAMNCVVAVSKEIKNNYDNAFGVECVEIPPLVPFDKSSLSKFQCRIKYGIPQDASVICMVGGIKSLKNPDTLVDAMAAMTDEEICIYNPYALYAGSGDMEKELVSKARELGLYDRIVFLGNVPKNEVKDVMKSSDVYLISSDSEGTSISLLEAMFNGMPIIASKAPGISDMVRNNVDCLMFDVKNHMQLKNCILKIFSSKNLSDKLSVCAADHYNKLYLYEDMLNSYISLFQNCDG